jgi:putative NADPH-quinone reductase
MKFRWPGAGTLLVVVQALFSVGASAQTLSANRYEISVTWGSPNSSVTMSKEVAAGEAVELPVGDVVLAVTMVPMSDSEFNLAVSVASTDEVSASLRGMAEQFKGGFGTPIEVGKADKDGTGYLATVTVRHLWE